MRFMTLPDVAEILNISASQTYALVRSGDLKGLLAGSGGFGRVPAGGSVCPRARFVTFRSRVLRD